MGPFVQVVLGQIISLFGNAALRFVLPLILLRQTGSAAVYGAATALALLPALAGTLAGGVLADRCRKARLMVVLDLAAAGLALGAAASADDLPTVLWGTGGTLCALCAAGAVSAGGAGQSAVAAGGRPPCAGQCGDPIGRYAG